MAAKRVVRRRRTAAEAREAILAAAELRFVESGPDGLRLQEIARDVGVAHPTVLHHFGSREGLLGAVIERVQSSIYGEVFAALSDADLEPESLAQLLERVAIVIGQHGRGRVLYWLALSHNSGSERKPLGTVVDLAHQLRESRGRSPGSREDTRFLVMLATFAITAESVLGSELFGASDADTGRRFRTWLGQLLSAHLQA